MNVMVQVRDRVQAIRHALSQSPRWGAGSWADRTHDLPVAVGLALLIVPAAVAGGVPWQRQVGVVTVTVATTLMWRMCRRRWDRASRTRATAVVAGSWTVIATVWAAAVSPCPLGGPGVCTAEQAAEFGSQFGLVVLQACVATLTLGLALRMAGRGLRAVAGWLRSRRGHGAPRLLGGSGVAR